MMARILIVDDEPALRRALERALRGQGYEVVSVGDPHHAYEILEGTEFDLVLLDIHLPHLNGDAFYLAMVRRWPHLRQRVILMSGDPWAARADWPDELMNCPLLTKPFTLDVLGKTVLDALRATVVTEQPRKRNG